MYCILNDETMMINDDDDQYHTQMFYCGLVCWPRIMAVDNIDSNVIMWCGDNDDVIDEGDHKSLNFSWISVKLLYIVVGG